LKKNESLVTEVRWTNRDFGWHRSRSRKKTAKEEH